MTRDQNFENWLRETRPGKGPCLIPNEKSITETSTLLLCHENDYCECDMNAAREWALKNDVLVREMKAQLEAVIESDACLPRRKRSIKSTLEKYNTHYRVEK